MSRPYDVYGIGHALVDIQHAVSTEFLQRLNIEKGVMTLIDAERRRALSAQLKTDPIHCASGGSAANTMIGVAQFGGRPYYACRLGLDPWGDFYQRDLERAGVGSSVDRRSEGETGQCLVFITPDADRTLNTFLGVSSQMGPEQIEEELIASSQYIYLEGYLLSSDEGFEACRRAQQLARRGAAGVALTLSDPFMVRSFEERFAQLLDAGVDLLFCNEQEARACTGAEDREEACRALAARVPAACVTCGAEGALVWAAGRRHQVPAVRVEALDTTGAGDIFAAGVLFGLTRGYDLLDAARLGSHAAAQVVARYGPRLEHSLQGEIDAILSPSE